MQIIISRQHKSRLSQVLQTLRLNIKTTFYLPLQKQKEVSLAHMILNMMEIQ